MSGFAKQTGLHQPAEYDKNVVLQLISIVPRPEPLCREQTLSAAKGIRLAKSNGKPFDIRVMVQKTREGAWVSTALFTKVGNPNKVATNYNQGGSIGTFKNTMSGANFGSAFTQQLESELKRLGVAVGRNFDRHYKGFKELGLDVAVDSKGRPWILEVNTRPQVYPLKTLKDKSLYHKVLSYGRQYGRTK